MRVTIDTTEAKSFELVEPGPYAMRVDEISEPRQTEKSTGIDVEFKFEDPKVDQIAGRVRRFYPITGKGAGFFREFWKATTGEDIPVGVQIDVDLDLAIGRPVICDIQHSTPRQAGDRVYNEVAKVISNT